MKKLLNIIKSILYYGWVSAIYFVLFCIIWFTSYVFINPYMYNHMVKAYTANKYGNSDTVIIAIDDNSLNEISWPWGFSQYSKIINYFGEYTNVKLLMSDFIINGKINPNEPSNQNYTGTKIHWKPDLEVFTDINIPTEEPTAVEIPKTEKADDESAIFDLNGRKTAVRSGELYIKNGKKFVNK